MKIKVNENKRVVSLAGSQTEVARILGYDDIRNVSNWTNRLMPFPTHHCVTLEQHFKGLVTRQSLRPHDWKKHWPELSILRVPAKAEE